MKKIEMKCCCGAECRMKDKDRDLEKETQAAAFDQARAQAQKMGDMSLTEAVEWAKRTVTAAGAAAGTEPAEEGKPWAERITFRGAGGEVVLRVPVKDGNGWVATNVALTEDQAGRLLEELMAAITGRAIGESAVIAKSQLQAGGGEIAEDRGGMGRIGEE